MGVVIPYLLNAGVGSCIFQGTVVLVFEPYQVDFPYELPNYPFNCAFVQANKFDQSVRYYTFNTNLVQGQQELAQFIDSIPNGYYVAMFSRYSSGIESWSPVVKSQLGKLGSAKIPHITNHHTAWALIGMKGEMPGMAVEDTVTNNDLHNSPNLPPGPTDPQDEMYVRIRREIILKWYTGNLSSQPIGPATKYKQLNVVLEDKDPLPKGRWWLDVIGINKQGKDTFLLRNQLQNNIDLSSIDADKYPYLKLKLGFVDSTYRTPHQIKYWQVLYEGGPELSVDVNAQYKFYASSIERGDSLALDLPIINLGDNGSDTTESLLEVVDEGRKIPYSNWMKVPPILPNQSALLKTKIPTQLLSGKNTLQVTINANKRVDEVSYLNNFLKQEFTVKGDVENPFLQVTFDGQRIFNRDIVSPNPIIRISSTDNNTYLLQKDTSTFELFLRKPGSFDFERVYLNNPDVIFTPATEKNESFILYSPKKLKDGVYALKVQATDASGNKAGGKAYEIEFTVVNKSTITHFYPYPNPFTTQMRFVFTLTGAKIPDQLLVRILTINGKVVREIRMEEFGNIRIGNNVSEFAWDGTDQYGDKLANGVYLYQVYTKINGDNIEQISTKARDESSFFVNGTGKIYLMR
jgi:flagellar hook assembly protein FlgD